MQVKLKFEEREMVAMSTEIAKQDVPPKESKTRFILDDVEYG